MSSNAGLSAKSLHSSGYFGRTFGLPPGVRGGGITGMLPVSGVGARISGSTPDGGHNTPSDFAVCGPAAPPPGPWSSLPAQWCPVAAPAARRTVGGGRGRRRFRRRRRPRRGLRARRLGRRLSMQKRKVGCLIRMRGNGGRPRRFPGTALNPSSRVSWPRSSRQPQPRPPRSCPVPASMTGLRHRGAARDAPARSRAGPRTSRSDWPTPIAADRAFHGFAGKPANSQQPHQPVGDEVAVNPHAMVDGDMGRDSDSASSK